MKEKIVVNDVEMFVEIKDNELFITDEKDTPIYFTPDFYSDVIEYIKSHFKTGRSELVYTVDKTVKPLNREEFE